jgi:serine/threonine protein kinase
LAAGSESWEGLPGLLAGEEPFEEPVLREVIVEFTGRRNSAETQAEAPTVDALPPNFLSPAHDPRHLGRLGPYDVLERIGRGGMGVVFKAFDSKLERPVAIKVMAPELVAQDSARKRFLREARAAAAVCHENVVTIHAVEEARGLPYLVMQYVAGGSLEERLVRERSLPLMDLLRVGIQVASGLAAAAHARGLVHRDIKPANILLEGSRVKITDFGLARAVDDSSISQSGLVTGTPEYMAPEQARGEFVDHRADLFSLGSLLYALGTGRPPFGSGNLLAVLRRVCEDTPQPVNEINPALPRWLAAIIGRLHAKDPAQRFQSAAEVGNLLERHLLQLQRSAPSVPQDVGARSPDLAPAPNLAPEPRSDRPLAATIVEELPVPPKRRWEWIALAAAAALLVGLPALGLLVLGYFTIGRGPTGGGERGAMSGPSVSDVPVQPIVTGSEMVDNSGKANAARQAPEELTAPRPPKSPPTVEGPRPAVTPTVPEPKLPGGKVEINLSEPFAQVRTGGGGRFLIFHLKKGEATGDLRPDADENRSGNRCPRRRALRSGPR